ncbi:MAG: lysophospholipid acyltransferase family protein [Proteobacteria bacterium]|jgi:1-acyl-sn-glycerol-3-phosphate acyltransferase|nr:lysophospholipid acyltransferase family protein [Pseudomonadota bacterium]MDA1289487.1 lysophospholipid acyltransferase family protein [Pseudomonadota bacterium]
MLSRLFLSLRSFVFYVGYYSGTVFISAFFILLFPVLPPKGRHVFASIWCGFVLGWLRICCGVRYVVHGLENLPNTPAIILANHQSSWETILFYKLVFPVSPILKKELTHIPFWGWSMRLLKPIAIDRSKPREAGRSLLIQGVDRIQNGNSVIIFPEGSRSKFGSVNRFSRGGAKLAIAAKTGIIPIAHNAGYCWPAHEFIKRPGIVTVVIGQRMEIGERDASELTADVEGWIREKVAELS